LETKLDVDKAQTTLDGLKTTIDEAREFDFVVVYEECVVSGQSYAASGVAQVILGSFMLVEVVLRSLLGLPILFFGGLLALSGRVDFNDLAKTVLKPSLHDEMELLTSGKRPSKAEFRDSEESDSAGTSQQED